MFPSSFIGRKSAIFRSVGSEINAASLACGRGPLFTMSYYIIIHHNDNFTVTCKSCYLVDSVCMG